MKWNAKIRKISFGAEDFNILPQEEIRRILSMCEEETQRYPMPLYSVEGYIMLRHRDIDAAALRCMKSSLYFLSNNTAKQYVRILIPKRCGYEARILRAPTPQLAREQRWINRSLLAQLPCHPCATAYLKGASVLKNAQPHAAQPMLLKLDITGFFDSITFGRVFKLFYEQVTPERTLAMLLAKLCCCNGVLPQGAPTSPAISNLCFRPCDEVIAAYCQAHAITYTRYCDDITLSGDFDPYAALTHMRKLLRAYGFRINEKKTRILGAGARQSVTGIVVNEKPQVGKEYRRKIRQEVYYMQQYGLSGNLRQETPYESYESIRGRYLNGLLGRINYVLFINGQDKTFQRYRDYLTAYRAHVTDSRRYFGDPFRMLMVSPEGRVRFHADCGFSPRMFIALRLEDRTLFCTAVPEDEPGAVQLDERNSLALPEEFLSLINLGTVRAEYSGDSVMLLANQWLSLNNSYEQYGEYCW